MKIFNFFEPLTDSNRNAQPLLNKIVNLLKDSEGNPIVIEPNLTVNSDNLHQHLNPTTYRDTSDATFPLINVIKPNSRNPSVADTWDQFLNLAFRPRQFTTAINDIYNMTILSTNTNHFTNRNRDGQPNCFFKTFLDLLDNTSSLYSSSSLDSEVHSSIINDGYVCWVEDVFETKSAFFNDHPTVALIKTAKTCSDIIKHALNIKSGQIELSSSSQVHYWDALRAIDSEQRFSHLNYWRPTSELLTMEDEVLLEYLEKINSIQICNYIKLNSLPSLQEGESERKVFSNFTSEFFQKFKKITKSGISDTLNENNIVKLDNLPPSSFHLTPLQTREYNYNYNSIFSTNSTQNFIPSGNDQTFLPIGGATGFIFPKVSIKEDASLPSTIIKECIQNNPNSRSFGIIFNGFTKSTTKQDYEFVSFTKTQALSRKGFFLPIYLPIKTLNSSFQEEISYIFNLLNCSDSYDMMKKRARSRNALRDFCTKYASDGMLFVDYESYVQRQAQLMKHLAEFSAINSDSYARFDSSEIEHLLSSLMSIKATLSSVVNTSTNDFSDVITSKLDVNSVIERKYNKVNTHYTRLKDQNSKSKTLLSENANKIKSNVLDIHNYKRQLEELTLRMKINEEESSKSYSDMKLNIQNRIDSIKTLIKNKSLHESLSERYQKAVNEAISHKKYFKTNFFSNLFENEAIKIMQIAFYNSSEDKREYVNSYSTDSLKNKFYQNFIEKSKTYTINEVTFLIDKPVPIKVDGGNKGVIAGGPYIVKVNSSRLSIALAYPSSIHGHTGQYIYTHPHAGSISTSSYLRSFSKECSPFNYNKNYNNYNFNYSSACLGEASSLVYKAFESNDLKSIIMSALTWVKNANSTDAWGRNYKFFPKYQDMLDQQSSVPLSDLPNVTEDEVEDFINEMLDTEESEAVSELDTQEPPTEETLVSQPPQTRSIQMFNTDDEYTPYTPR